MAASAKFIAGSGDLALDDAVFSESFHMPIVHEAVRAELNARRQGTSSTRTRGEVAMSGAKAFRQKGTGRARAGALSTPQRVGGGVAFGPKPRHYTLKVNRKARRRALRAALSLHAERGTLALVDPSAFDEPSTKQAAEALARFSEGSALALFAREGEDNAVKSFRNLAGVTVLPYDAAGVADVVGHDRLILTPSALEDLTRRASKK
jgi:large subunit ribosomal protein L4